MANLCAMFLRKTERRKNGKTHLYWSVVENRRLDGGRVVQHHVLYLGEINSSQAEAWRSAVEVFDEEAGRARTLALFPEDRCEAPAGDDVIRRIENGVAWVTSCGATVSGPSDCQKAAKARAGITCCRC